MNPAIRLHYQSSFSNNPAHAMASEVREFDPQAWNDYYKFCFVRNPFDYAVSEYFWLRCPVRGVSFKEFLLRKLDETRPDPEGISVYPSTNWEIYTINDEIAVDRVGKFENIYQDIEEISGEIGLKIDSHLLPHLKSETRKKTFRQVYDDDTRLLAEKIYSKELTAFAYSF